MGLRIGAIVWGVLDIEEGVRFWSEALDYRLEFPAEEDFALLNPKEGEGVPLSLNRVTSEKARRHHMDLFTENLEAERERLLSLGASLAEWDYHEGEDYLVMKDPQGNPFCLLPIHGGKDE